MRKIILFVLMILFVIPMYYVSDAIGQDKDCQAIRDDLRALNVDYRAKYDDYREDYDKFREYHKQIHNNKYKATGKPLIDTYRKCKKNGTENEAFCKGTIEDFNKLEAKKKTAKELSDSAKAIADESKQKYKDLYTKAVEMGCQKSKDKTKEKTDTSNKK